MTRLSFPFIISVILILVGLGSTRVVADPRDSKTLKKAVAADLEAIRTLKTQFLDALNGRKGVFAYCTCKEDNSKIFWFKDMENNPAADVLLREFADECGGCLSRPDVEQFNEDRRKY
jgi:hypothetical protein